jgi:hypothetical protein
MVSGAPTPARSPQEALWSAFCIGGALMLYLGNTVGVMARHHRGPPGHAVDHIVAVGGRQYRS